MQSNILTSYPANPIKVPGVGGGLRLPRCYIPINLPSNQNYNKIINTPTSSTIVQTDEKISEDAHQVANMSHELDSAQKNQSQVSSVKPVPDMFEQLPTSSFTPKKMSSKEIDSLKRPCSPSPSSRKQSKPKTT